MTPDRRFHRDVRQDARGLWERAGVTLPAAILADGTAAPDQLASFAPHVDLRRAGLPCRECGSDPAPGIGAAVVGTREPELTPYIAHAPTSWSSPTDTLVSEADHLRWLTRISGLGAAPATVWKLGGWQLGWLAAFLSRLKSGGAQGALIVAERQAAAAVRQLWLVSDAIEPPTLAASGAVLVVRSLIDLVAAAMRLFDEWAADGTLMPSSLDRLHAVRAMMLTAVERIVALVESAARAPDTPIRFRALLKLSRTLVDALGMFTVGSESPAGRIRRIERKLGKAVLRTAMLSRGDAGPVLAALNDRLTTVASNHCADAAPAWPERHRLTLARLAEPDLAVRAERIAVIRSDLIYRLLLTRRIDTLWLTLPWMAALSGVFPGVYGGALGALAQMFELARAFEIARELVRRLYDPDGTQRLDTKLGKAAYKNGSAIATSVTSRTRAGFLLAEAATSHHMVQAWLNGETFASCHPIATAAAGRLDWSFRRSAGDTATAATISMVELAKPVYIVRSYEKDLPRYMGLAVVPLLGSAITTIFRGELRGPAFREHAEEVDAFDRKVLKRAMPEGVTATCGIATREAMRAMLRALDVDGDGVVDEWRSDAEVMANSITRELDRADARLNRHTPLVKDRHGGAIRRAASNHDKAAGSPADPLWRLIDRARSWTPRKPGSLSVDDAGIEAVLAGGPSPTGLTPVAPSFVYALWFRPDIDAKLMRWIGTGALAGSGVSTHAQAIESEVAAMRAAAPALYATTAPIDARMLRTLVPLFTGLTSITADHTHLR